MRIATAANASPNSVPTTAPVADQSIDGEAVHGSHHAGGICHSAAQRRRQGAGCSMATGVGGCDEYHFVGDQLRISITGVWCFVMFNCTNLDDGFLLTCASWDGATNRQPDNHYSKSQLHQSFSKAKFCWPS